MQTGFPGWGKFAFPWFNKFPGWGKLGKFPFGI